jgi:hypothetical protein
MLLIIPRIVMSLTRVTRILLSVKKKSLSKRKRRRLLKRRKLAQGFVVFRSRRLF